MQMMTSRFLFQRMAAHHI